MATTKQEELLNRITKMAQTVGFSDVERWNIVAFERKFETVEREYVRRYNKKLDILQKFESAEERGHHLGFFQSLFMLTPSMCIAVLRLLEEDTLMILSMRYEYVHEQSSELTIVIAPRMPYDLSGDEEEQKEEFTSADLDDIEFFKLLRSGAMTKQIGGDWLPSMQFLHRYPDIPRAT